MNYARFENEEAYVRDLLEASDVSNSTQVRLANAMAGFCWFAPCLGAEARQKLESHPLKRMLPIDLRADVQGAYRSESVRKWLDRAMEPAPARLRLIVPVYLDIEVTAWDGTFEEGKTYIGSLDEALVEEILENYLGHSWASMLLVEVIEDSEIVAAILPAFDGDAHVFWSKTQDLPGNNPRET